MVSAMSADHNLEVGPPVVARLKHPRSIRWLHWINLPLLAIMIWSGLRIYWAERSYDWYAGL